MRTSGFPGGGRRNGFRWNFDSVEESAGAFNQKLHPGPEARKLRFSGPDQNPASVAPAGLEKSP